MTCKDGEIPRGWILGPLATFVTPRGEKALPAAMPGAVFIGMDHIEANTTRIVGSAVASKMKSAGACFRRGDVLYGRLRPYLNKVAIPTFDGLASAEFIVFPDTESVRSQFLKYRLNAADFVSFASHLNEGDRPRVSFDQIGSFQLRLPPPAEQLRIVAKIEELFSELDKGVEALTTAREQLKAYRQSVLKAAVMGDLTREWRKRRKGKIKPKDELLQRILKDHREVWQTSELRKMTEKGVDPTDDRWKRKYKVPNPPETGELPQLPDGWAWVSVELAGEVRLGRQRAPEHHTGKHMRPYLRVANVLENRLDISDVMQMNFTPQEFETYALRSGDILLNEGQSPELVGRPAMYRGEISGCCYQKTLLRFRAYRGIKPEFALLVFRHYLHSGRFRAAANITTSIGHLAAERFVAIEFPVPPQEEQVQIIEAAANQLSLADHLESDLKLCESGAATLRDSVLREAFAGRLVAQDPNEPPASAVLERIRSAQLVGAAATERAIKIGKNGKKEAA